MKAIQFGAGNIGRGFMGQLFTKSGYEVIFVDVIPDLIEKINKDHCYPVKIISQKQKREIIIDNVRAVNGGNIDNVSNEIVNADLIATSVGVNVLSKSVKPLSFGLKKRWKFKNFNPINIIICKNLLDAVHFLHKIISDDLDANEKEYLDKYVGLVEASIGRMVPVMTKEMQKGNILRVWVEEYSDLPVDKNAFKGTIPEIKNMIPFSPFRFYIERKLFIHKTPVMHLLLILEI